MPRLTKTLVKQFETEGGERVVADSEVRGLVLRIRPGARASYFFRYSFDGKPRKLSIGLTTEFDPDRAREVARAFRDKLARGEDPGKAREAARQGVTVAEFLERFMEDHARAKLKAKTVKNYESAIRLHILPKIGTRPVQWLDEADIQAVLKPLRDLPGAALVAYAVLCSSMNLAEKWCVRPPHSNPTRFVDAPKTRKRDRLLTPEELGRLGEALREFAVRFPEACTLVRVLLFTGARLNEIRLARAEHLDAERGVLLLPDSKTGRGELLLSGEALEIVRGIDRQGSPWLIPGPAPGKPVSSPHYSWAIICKAVGLKDLHLHDLRHAFASYAHRGGGSMQTVMKLLRHTSAKTTARYTHALQKDVADAANQTAEIVKALMSAKV